MPIDIGSLATVEWTRPAGHIVTLAVTKPDGTPIDPAPTVTDAAGKYSARVLVEYSGRYLLQWTDTTDERTYADTLEVWPRDPRFLISLEDAMNHLGWRDPDKNANGAKLRLYVAAATEVIEDIVGAILIRTVVQPADGGRSGVPLWERPSEIVSVVVNGAATTAYTPNLNAAIVYAGGRDGGRFPDGRQNVIITYRTGASSVAPSIQLATSELIRHLWQVGQQAPAPSAQNASADQAHTPSGFAVPRRVIELCQNTYRLPGTA
ncbi:hypothetical protein ACYX8G_19655 [Microbacterium saperdae]